MSNSVAFFSRYPDKTGRVGRLTSIVDYEYVKNNSHAWKIEVNKTQRDEGFEILKTHDIYLNVEYLKELNPYFENMPTSEVYKLFDTELNVFDSLYITKVLKPNEEIEL